MKHLWRISNVSSTLYQRSSKELAKKAAQTSRITKWESTPSRPGCVDLFSWWFLGGELCLWSVSAWQKSQGSLEAAENWKRIRRKPRSCRVWNQKVVWVISNTYLAQSAPQSVTRSQAHELSYPVLYCVWLWLGGDKSHILIKGFGVRSPAPAVNIL